MTSSRRLASLFVLVPVLCLAAAASSTPSAPQAQAQGEATIRLAEIRAHLAAFQRIANANDGHRLAGTAGYDASAEYVARRMRAAGYRVRLQVLGFPFVADRSPPVLRTTGGRGWRARRDFATLAYSGSGRVEAPVVAVDALVPSPRANTSTSGCGRADFEGFPRGAVALLQRGTCRFRVKVENAIAAGASAAIVFNEGNPGRRDVFGGTLGPPQVSIPALAASFEVGERLRNGVPAGPTGMTATLVADMVAERRRTVNVIADSRRGDPRRTVVVGAHLDSVQEGPGINDNGSGSAVLLEVAEAVAGDRSRNRLRFVWWGAEELGLLGSRHYVAQLSTAERARHALYLNFDMVGSPNFVPFVYDGDGSSGGRSTLPAGSAPIERVLTTWFSARGLPYRETSIGASSDHFPFVQAGIPVGGLFTGAGGRKSAAQAAAFGGRAGRPFDPCYHRACDTLANVSGVALLRMARAAEHAVRRFARDLSGVR